ncbi:MAG: hypothetical protein ABWZ64_19275 [Xanthobacteraceae bacterium]|jgi:hypothetical protein
MSEIRGEKADQTSENQHLTSARRIAQAAVAIGAFVALLVPAFVNGFPFVFADTGGYLARPFEHTLALGRSALYGLVLASTIGLNFWPAIIVQLVIVLWLLRTTLRVHGMEGTGIFAFALALLIMFTSLPWYAGMLMPDIFVPVAALALHLLAFSHRGLRRTEQAILVAVLAFAMASHMSILALVAALLVVMAALKLIARHILLPSPHITRAMGGVVAGIAIAMLSNLAVAGQPRLTPGGSTFFFARLLQDGIIARYLDDHCPDARISLCAFRSELPRDSDEWLWGNSPLGKLGGWDAFEPEARRIIIASMLAYPWLHVRTGIAATIEQFFTVGTGEGFLAKDNWHAEIIFRQYAPEALPSFAASVQQHDGFEFRILNMLHVPVAIVSALLLPLFSVQLRQRRPQLAVAATIAFFALLANAAICGIVSNPNPRYQSRIAPLAALVTLMIIFDRARSLAERATATRIL